MTPIYVGSGGVNRKVKELTVGVNGVNRKVKEAWAGVNGVNRKVFSSGILVQYNHWFGDNPKVPRAFTWLNTPSPHGYSVITNFRGESSMYYHFELTFVEPIPITTLYIYSGHYCEGGYPDQISMMTWSRPYYSPTAYYEKKDGGTQGNSSTTYWPNNYDFSYLMRSKTLFKYEYQGYVNDNYTGSFSPDNIVLVINGESHKITIPKGTSVNTQFYIP